MKDVVVKWLQRVMELQKTQTEQGEMQVFHWHAEENRVKRNQENEVAPWLLKWLSLAGSSSLRSTVAGCATSACGCRWLCLSLERERSLAEGGVV